MSDIKRTAVNRYEVKRKGCTHVFHRLDTAKKFKNAPNDVKADEVICPEDALKVEAPKEKPPVPKKPKAKVEKEETILEDLEDGVPKKATIEKIKKMMEDKK